MWGLCKVFCSYFNLNGHPKCQNHKKQSNQENLLPIRIPDEYEDVPPLSSCKMFLASWLFGSSNNASAFVKYLILALFSPLLLPLICATFPFLCALELFFHLSRWGCWRRRRKSSPAAEEGCAGDGKIRGEDGGNGERLLQRYLEDQLMLVARSLYGDDDDDEEEEILEADVEYFGSKSPST
ncbi:uncharacterized protein LOC113750013 [Coffea eugenioides]|uniref:Uncharacterized protein n=1 Tax=Coffea arabica TaxID=13443 RepID=A0ABM4VTI0_COFAR|nr:uncharacterized protein LOC113750013 [Coffea eugenioides]